MSRQIDVAAAKRLLLTVAVVGIGWTAGHLFNLDRLPYTSFYLFAATALLAIGLYGSTSEISVTHVRRDLRTVLAAVTVGVLLKAVLISAVMLAMFQHPQYLVFGIAVAQIDPLSVAALQGKSRMSRRAKDILLAWASFDDPITVILTVYISAITLTAMGADASGPGSVGGNVASLLVSIPINVGFAVLGLLLWWLTTQAGTARPAGAGLLARAVGTEDVRGGRRALAVCLLPVLAGFGVWQSLMLGVALLGLFYRPRIQRQLGPLTQFAFLVAAFALGLLLVGGIRLVPGLVLGAVAFLSQMLVAALLTRGFPRVDRVHLALAQQNGITAIILALLLEPRFRGTVAVIAPAILVIGVLNIGSNAAFDNRQAIAAAVRRRRAFFDWCQVQAAPWRWALRMMRHVPTPWVARDEQADEVVRQTHRRLVLAAKAAAGVTPPKRQRPDVKIAANLGQLGNQSKAS